MTGMDLESRRFRKTICGTAPSYLSHGLEDA
jgi:hypothetical protein